ncbi:MAG: transcription elongation factor GreA [Filifactoraceae bacterium]
MESKEMLLTQEGYTKIEEELDYLKSVKRHEISERIKIAISFGDLSENAEYDEAKNEQAETENRITKLENILRSAVIIDESKVDSKLVTVGSKVKFAYMEDGKVTDEEEEYTIVGSAEADTSKGKISNESPIGIALLGNKKGKVTEVMAPNGTYQIKILNISR